MHLAGLGEIITVDMDDQCHAAGGTVVGYIRTGTAAYDKYGRKIPGNVRCALPPPAPPPAPVSAPAQITVSPVISTQVSPQISPVFQQQYQPTNSPATAGTTMTGPTAPAVSQPVGVNESSQLPAAPVPVQGPVYAPAPAPVYAMAAPEQLPPAPVSAPAPVSETVYTPAPSAPPFDWKIAAILGAVTIGAVILSGNKKG